MRRIYTAVDAALAKVKALNGDLYKNFSDVTAAVNAVDRDKSFKEQADVDAMAKAIEDALAALELKPVDNQVEIDNTGAQPVGGKQRKPGRRPVRNKQRKSVG